MVSFHAARAYLGVGQEACPHNGPIMVTADDNKMLQNVAFPGIPIPHCSVIEEFSL